MSLMAHILRDLVVSGTVINDAIIKYIESYQKGKSEEKRERAYLVWVALTDEQRIWALREQIDKPNIFETKKITHYCNTHACPELKKLPWLLDDGGHGGCVILHVHRPFELFVRY